MFTNHFSEREREREGGGERERALCRVVIFQLLKLYPFPPNFLPPLFHNSNLFNLARAEIEQFN